MNGERQVWKRPVVPAAGDTRERPALAMHLDVVNGRVSLHESVAAQLLLDAGWERAE